jgi:HD-like signal output (HDOD) protein
MHVEYGFLMMEKWKMPEIYCDVTRNHHAEEWRQSNTLLAAVRLVNKACNRLGIGMRPEPDLVLFATVEAQMLGLREITIAELEIAIEDALGQISPGARQAVA